MDIKSLEDKIIVASPHTYDEHFKETLIYIYSHNGNGTVGIILNQQIGSIDSKELLKNTKQQRKHKHSKKLPVMFGGPVNTDAIMGISLNEKEKDIHKHSPLLSTAQSINIHTDLTELSDSLLLSKMTTKFVIMKGMSAWDTDQLEREIKEGCWLISNAGIDILFSLRIKNKWKHIIKKMGVKTPEYVVPYSGKA